ncbi:barstar family protein [Antrihabitans cavernicola]|uniref:Barstar family protein n=1 Tax=Antrihabitans cavernicola TaxID=2495913 RepID=A0A5A7SEP2_9NOCA|nr:barstar family protein [Spelaeibacter cavernicola]KAA0022701.1 barstar family protein [Spelaeibacter cavernicola]
MTVEQFMAGNAVIGVLEADHGAASGLRYSLPEAGYVVREVRGSKMRTVDALFDEFAAAFQFPYYFGANKDAFDEVMRDLDEFVGAAPGYVVVVRDADQLLADDPDQLSWFADAMSFYAENWADRTDPATFRVVLHTADAAFAKHTPSGAVALNL